MLQNTAELELCVLVRAVVMLTMQYYVDNVSVLCIILYEDLVIVQMVSP